MGIYNDITSAKGFHLYEPNANKATGFGINLGTGVLNDLFGPKSDYVLEVWIAGRLDRAIILPIHPEAIEIRRPQSSTVNYTFGYLAHREHTLHRNLQIRLNGRSGVATRQAHDREGATTLKTGPEFLRELDAFLDYYNAMCVARGDYFSDPVNYRDAYNAVTLVFRSFSEHLHVRVEPTDWKMRRAANSTRFGYEWDLGLQAYAPATPEKAPTLLGQVGDAMAFVNEAILAAGNVVAMSRHAVDGTTSLANSIRGPLQAAGQLATQLDQLSGSVVRAANVPRLFMRDVAQSFGTARNAYERLVANKGGGFGSIAEGISSEVRNLERHLGLLDEAATGAATAAGLLGAGGDTASEGSLSTATPIGAQPNPNPASWESDSAELYAMPGSPVLPYETSSEPPTAPVIVAEGDTLLTLAEKHLGSSRYWMALASVNNMPTAYYRSSGAPLKAGDTILVPRTNEVVAKSVLSPTQDLSSDRFGQDIYLNPVTGDLELQNQADVRTVRDAANLEQAIRNRLLTRQGESTYFPRYGLPALIGTKVTAETLGYVASSLNAQLISDPRIVEVDSMTLTDEGDTLTGYIEVVPVIGANVSVISPI